MECGFQGVIPSVCGLPGPESLEQSEGADVFTGGCAMSEDGPDRRCKGCGRQW